MSSQEQIEAFRRTHFSPNATTSFFANFLPADQTGTNFFNEGGNAENPYKETGSAEVGKLVADTVMGECESGYDEEEEDDLGYYPDGVKRTLTDAQIAIFRHTELQEMLRAQHRSLMAEKEEADAIANDAQNTQSSSAPEDYCTHNPRARPTLAEVSTTVSLPWDDEDVGAWQSVQQQQEQQEKEIGKEDKRQDVVYKSNKKPVIRPIFDAPSGKQFFWPVIEGSG